MVNPKSLANLRGGSKPGHKRKLSIKFVNDYSKMMSADYPLFLEKLHSLPPKDYVEAYIKLVKIVLPKQINIQAENVPAPVFTIQLATDEDATNYGY